MPGRAILESVAEQIAHELYGGETVPWRYVIDGDIDENGGDSIDSENPWQYATHDEIMSDSEVRTKPIARGRKKV